MSNITYEQASKALDIIMNAGGEPPPKPRVIEPMNRKQRRIQESKQRRKK